MARFKTQPPKYLTMRERDRKTPQQCTLYTPPKKIRSSKVVQISNHVGILHIFVRVCSYSLLLYSQPKAGINVAEVCFYVLLKGYVI